MLYWCAHFCAFAIFWILLPKGEGFGGNTAREVKTLCAQLCSMPHHDQDQEHLVVSQECFLTKMILVQGGGQTGFFLPDNLHLSK